jgi:hypothetical protein
MSGGCRSVGVGRKVVELCDSIVRALWHGVLLTRFDRSDGSLRLEACPPSWADSRSTGRDRLTLLKGPFSRAADWWPPAPVLLTVLSSVILGLIVVLCDPVRLTRRLILSSASSSRAVSNSGTSPCLRAEGFGFVASIVDWAGGSCRSFPDAIESGEFWLDNIPS